VASGIVAFGDEQVLAFSVMNGLLDIADTHEHFKHSA